MSLANTKNRLVIQMNKIEFKMMVYHKVRNCMPEYDQLVKPKGSSTDSVCYQIDHRKFEQLNKRFIEILNSDQELKDYFINKSKELLTNDLLNNLPSDDNLTDYIMSNIIDIVKGINLMVWVDYQIRSIPKISMEFEEIYVPKYTLI